MISDPPYHTISAISVICVILHRHAAGLLASYRLPPERITTPQDATHWSSRTLARAQGVSEATVRRIWRAHGLQPHRTETFELSRDPGGDQIHLG